jgi:hypothetical protein
MIPPGGVLVERDGLTESCWSSLRLLNDRYRVGELQIDEQIQTIIHLEELGSLLGSDRFLKLKYFPRREQSDSY